MNEIVPMINESSDDLVSLSSLEMAFKHSGLGKKSKQRFLKSTSKDDTIKKGTKGAGGNTTTFNCHIIRQSIIPDDTFELLRKGQYSMQALLLTFSLLTQDLPKKLMLLKKSLMQKNMVSHFSNQ